MTTTTTKGEPLLFLYFLHLAPARSAQNAWIGFRSSKSQYLMTVLLIFPTGRIFRVNILGCGDLLKPEVVQSTAFSSLYSASHVLVLAEVDVGNQNGKANFWLAEGGKTTGQGFTLQVGVCKSLIAGCQIKNKGRELISGVWNNWWSTKAGWQMLRDWRSPKGQGLLQKYGPPTVGAQHTLFCFET